MANSFYEVSICKYALFGEPNEFFDLVAHHDLRFDAVGIDTKVPTFSFKLGNKGGLARDKWDEADVVRITRNKKLVFLGSIDTISPSKSNSSSLVISGTHYYYRVLMDTYLTSASNLAGSRLNVWRYGRNTDASNGLIDGINPGLIMKAVTGSKLVSQEFFDDMDNIDNVDWTRLSSDTVDITGASGLDNPSFESGLTGWSFQETNNDGNGGVAFNTANPMFTTTTTSTEAKDGNGSASVQIVNGAAANNQSGLFIFQDNVSLTPGDVITAYTRVASTNNATQKDEALKYSAEMLVFQNGSYEHPWKTGSNPNDPLTIYARQASFKDSWVPLGGAANIQSAGTYRVGILVRWNSTLSTTTHATDNPDLLVDYFQIQENSGFSGVALYDGNLKLKNLSDSTSDPKYVTTGTAETVDYYVGNPNQKALPYFRNKTTLRVVGKPDNSGNIPVPKLIYKKHGYAGAADTVDTELDMTLVDTELRQQYDIIDVNTTSNYFAIAGNKKAIFPTGGTIKITGSTGNNGNYSILSTTYDVVTKETRISVASVPDATVDGKLQFPNEVTRWTYEATPPSERDKVRIKFDLNGDGASTPAVDYFLLDADIESYSRAIKIVNGQQVYRDDKTGLSIDTSNIDDYIFPTDLTTTPDERYTTFALEFFNQPMMVAVEEVLRATIKHQTLDSTVVDGLPAGRDLVARDSNWDFTIDNKGVIHFTEHLGKYYGKHAIKQKEFSFRKRNLSSINVTTTGKEIVNSLVYQGQGIGGVNTLVLSGNEFINEESVNKYGLRSGHVNEKKSFDFVTAVGRAHAVLRDKAFPTTTVQVQLEVGCADDVNIGDIVWIRDIDTGIMDDFRVLDKRYDINDSSGESITIEMSTKKPTLQSFVSTIGKKLNPLNNFNQGSGFANPVGGNPKVISRDVPYILPVDIPADAQSNLVRVLLDMHTEGVYNTQAILSAESGHTHEIPSLTVNMNAHDHTYTLPNHTHNVDFSVDLAAENTENTRVGTLVSGDTSKTDDGPDTDTQGAKTSQQEGGAGLHFDQNRGDWLNESITSSTKTFTHNQSGINEGGTSGAGGFTKIPLTGTSRCEWIVVEVGLKPDTGNDDYYWDLAIETDGVITWVSGQTFVSNLNAGVSHHVRYALSANELPVTVSEVTGIRIRLAKVGAAETVDLNYTIDSWKVHRHLHSNPALNIANGLHSHTVNISGSTAGSATSGNPNSTPNITGSSQTVGGTSVATASAVGSAHVHDSAFELSYNRDADGNILFPTNINVYLNSVDGISNVDLDKNSGPVPELSGIGVSETGDLVNAAGDPTSQDIGIGTAIENHDISHLFKGPDDKWLPGRHYLVAQCPGHLNQVNDSNIGILNMTAKLEKVTNYNHDLGGPE